jgi:hypothetical protein
MMRPMNDSKKELALICDECEGIATHCDAETTDYPLILCVTHALEYSMIYGGAVRISLGRLPASVAMTAGTRGMMLWSAQGILPGVMIYDR